MQKSYLHIQMLLFAFYLRNLTCDADDDDKTGDDDDDDANNS